MKAVDTNILARFFINDPDDPEASRQQKVALSVLSQPVFVSLTVILELEWVMRGFYKLSRVEILTVFKALFGLLHVTIEDKAIAMDVLEKYEGGMDFADALHVAKAQHCQAFVTFDQKLANKANQYQDNIVIELVK
jgi:predicted nucleic-acid-binding protein